MRWMGILALVAAVAAGESDPAAQVKRLAADGKKTEAARLAGGWLADAQKRGDLLDEQAAWEALRDIQLDDAQYREACAEVMKLLDPKRNGAYLSAHLLAHELVRAAVREGDDRHVADASAVLSAPRKDAGSCNGALADLAAGVLAARKEQEDAAAHLMAAFDAALKNGWLDLAMYAGIEIACVDKKVGRASDTLKRLDDALKASKDPFLLRERNRLASKRIPEATFPVEDDGMEGGAGGAGGAGGSAGRAAESAVGAAWKKHPTTKGLLKVKRAGKGFEIEPQFAGAPKGTCGPKWGEHHWRSGGVTLSFYDAGVALRMVDPTGLDGIPGDGAPGEWSVFYLLAPGETWSVTKKGVVSVGK